MSTRDIGIMLLASVLTACSAGPRLDTTGVDPHITTAQAASNPTALMGRRILWAGIIVHGENRRDSSLLEVLAYPLRYNNRPDTGAKPLGRFLIEQHGYLETVDYAPGRALTVVGTLSGLRPGKVGDAAYHYPVVTAPQLRLWPADSRNGSSDPQFHIGVGVIFHN